MENEIRVIIPKIPVKGLPTAGPSIPMIIAKENAITTIVGCHINRIFNHFLWIIIPSSAVIENEIRVIIPK